MNIDEILSELRPFVTGIRFIESIPVVDTNFKENWVIPKSKIINFERGSKNKNYYMFYTEKEGIGINEIIEYIRTIIKINIERELKVKLLKEKIVELKELFKTNNLGDLHNLRFIIGEPDITNQMIKEDDLIDEFIDDNALITEIQPQPIIEKKMVEQPKEIKPKVGEPEYVKEIEGEFTKIVLPNIELPPKKKEMVIDDGIPQVPQECTCGADDICPVCAPNKGF